MFQRENDEDLFDDNAQHSEKMKNPLITCLNAKII